MVGLVINPSLLQTIFLISVSFSTIFSRISATISHPIHLGNETDKLSLLVIKEQLYDPRQVLSSWNESTHFCGWVGVLCGRRHQRVVGLDLSAGGLAGAVSPHIGNLSFMRYIYFENNTFRGNIPREISHLSRLKALSLDNNSFTGQIPSNLTQCSNLIHLFLDSNELVGQIPGEFGSFTKLLWLTLQQNHLTGRIPVALGNLSSLYVLRVGDNHLDGSIPNSLGQLKVLAELILSQNRLSGMVPPSIYNLSALQYFNLGYNQLQGSLPQSIGHDFPNLNNFNVVGNQFSGTLPVSLFTNASISTLDLGHNTFSGQVPKEVGNLKELNYLSIGYNHFGSAGKVDDLGFITSLSNSSNLNILVISSNKFGGRFPATLTNLSVTLTTLHLSGNQIFGSIPWDISKLKNLVQFEASNNSITGTIPKDIAMLQNLQHLGLGMNTITGKIPNAIQNMTSLYSLYLSHNMLEGNVEPGLWKCPHLQLLYIGNNRLTGILSKQIFDLPPNLLVLDLRNNFLIGSLPQEVGQLKNLQALTLSGNKLSGEIPSTLGSCFSLQYLYLDNNFFQGHISSSFGDLVAIEFINLSQNKLFGKIPEVLENLTSLTYFNISFNNFEGEVPLRGIFQNVTGFSMVGNDKLCGGSIKLKLPKCHTQKSKKKKFPLALKVTIGVFVPLSVVSTLLVLLALHRRKKSSTNSVSKKYANELQHISYHEIREATNTFSTSNLIGIGSFASVYKGILHKFGSTIAVKVFNLMERGASKSFKAECEILRKVRHRNLLKILTVCSGVDFDGNDFKALILEFMPYGSLEDWLHPSSDRSQRSPRRLNLLQMLNIATDIAGALDYLHNCTHTPIVHCDLKPCNVLLSEDLVAHVSDFGLAKFLSQGNSSLDKSETRSNIVRGTVGYIPPEYGMGSAVSTKGDVYSYGIMLLEMFTGKRPTDEMFNDNMSLHNFCKVNLVERDVGILNIIPLTEQLQNDIEEGRSMSGSTKKCLLSVIEIGVACSSEVVGDRMEIKDVLMKIEKIKEMFLKSVKPGVITNIGSHI